MALGMIQSARLGEEIYRFEGRGRWCSKKLRVGALVSALSGVIVSICRAGFISRCKGANISSFKSVLSRSSTCLTESVVAA